jgi:tRNA modification GTPase
VQNGRLDLTQAEAIADLVNAETDAQRRQALRQYEGQLSALYEDWRDRLIRAGAWIEAILDFPDEEIPEAVLVSSRTQLDRLRGEIAGHLQDARRGEILRDGLHVAVIGPPNAGKSSLVNALTQRDVVIVSEVPGTTRDIVEVRLDLLGYPVVLADTAGLRETGDAVEREGVRRALSRADAADLRLLVLDGALPRPAELPAADIVVLNKADRVRDRGPGFWVSAQSGEGLAALIAALAERAKTGLSGDSPVLTRARHRHALEGAREHLDAALSVPAARQELVAEHVRQALRAIGRITGRVDLDELLDVVFRDFCIGK